MDASLVDVFCQSLFASNHATTTITTYRHIMYRFAVYLEASGKTLLTATESNAEQWLMLHKTESNLSNLTIRSYLVTLKQFYKWAERKGLVEKSPVQHMKFGARPRIPRIPDLQLAMDLLYAPAEPTFVAVRDRSIGLMLSGSGCRISEACSIRLTDLDLERGEFRVEGKGDKERICYLSGAPLDAVAEYVYVYRKKLDPATDHVWVTQDGRPMNARNFQESLRSRATKAGFSKVHYPSGYTRGTLTAHKLRHLFATTLYLNGADLLTIKDLLGHESVSTTQIYTHIVGDQRRKAHMLFPGNLTPSPTIPEREVGDGVGAARTTTGDRSQSIPRVLTRGIPENVLPFRPFA